MKLPDFMRKKEAKPDAKLEAAQKASRAMIDKLIAMADENGYVIIAQFQPVNHDDQVAIMPVWGVAEKAK